MGIQGYASFWNKYRPAILQLMVAAAEGPQTYKFFKHELKALNPKEKTYSFTVEAYQGKAIDNFKLSTIAKDLVYVLTLSPKASELMESDMYAFELDKQFVFHVTKIEMVVEDEEEEEEGVESENPKRRKITH